MNREIKFRAYTEFYKYEVGDDGSVWSLDYNHSGQRRIMKQYYDRDGYRYVFLVINGKRFKRLVHRMVANVFIPNPENKPQVNHIDGVRDNNRVENLEWCTAKENSIHGWNNGRVASDVQKNKAREMFTGSKNPKSKLNEAQILSIRRLRAKGISLKDIAERHGISKSQVSSIANNKSWIL
jgi:hypothetical protein